MIIKKLYILFYIGQYKGHQPRISQPQDILDKTILWMGGGRCYSVHCTKFKRSIPAFYPVDASSISPVLKTKNYSGHLQMSPGRKITTSWKPLH